MGKLYAKKHSSVNTSIKVIGSSLLIGSVIATSHYAVAALQSMPTLSTDTNLKTGVQGILDAVKQTITTTSITGKEYADKRRETSEKSQRVKSVNELSRKIIDGQMDRTFGLGVSKSLNCHAAAENQTAQIKNASTAEQRVKLAQVFAQSAYADAAEKRAARAISHLEDYCDLSETKFGLCIPKPNGLSSADTNYATINSVTSLSPAEEMASRAYVSTIIDPSRTYESDCDNLACKHAEVLSKPYSAFASMSQNAYISQINDRLIYDSKGIYDYSKPVEAANEEIIKTVNPEDAQNIVRGNASTTASAPASTPSATTSMQLVIGDSIADGIKNQYKKDGQTRVGASPSDVLGYIKGFKAKDANFYKGKTVVLSSGFSNNNAKSSLTVIEGQLKELQGANVTLVGVANEYNVNGRTGAEMNKELQALASKYGAKFTGGFTAGNDKIHPKEVTSISVGL